MDSVFVVLQGNLGRDPEMRYTPTGMAVTDFSMACNRTWHDAAGVKQKETTWFKVSVWGKQGESANEWLKKGKGVVVTGRLQVDKATGGPRLWQDRDGNWRAGFEVTATSWNFPVSGGDGKPNGAEEERDVDKDFPADQSTTASEKKEKASSPPPEEPDF